MSSIVLLIPETIPAQTTADDAETLAKYRGLHPAYGRAFGFPQGRDGRLRSEQLIEH
jgi:hypothetical protein